MSDASTTIDAVADATGKVREFLSSFEDVEFAEDGSCSLQYGSARVYITVGVFDEDQAIVRVAAQAVTGATVSPELYEHVATFQADMGHLTVDAAADGTATIRFSHSLLGEFLNPAELRMTVVAVAFGADSLDDGLAERFGGTVHDAASNKG
jgi:hypothetical protein